jgi:hypothetical protein
MKKKSFLISLITLAAIILLNISTCVPSFALPHMGTVPQLLYEGDVITWESYWGPPYYDWSGLYDTNGYWIDGPYWSTTGAKSVSFRIPYTAVYQVVYPYGYPPLTFWGGSITLE